MEINELLQLTVDNKASDLHLVVGLPPTIRVEGQLNPVNSFSPLTGSQVVELVMQIINPEQKESLLANKEIDFSFDFENKVRFRGNAYFQRGTLALSLRLVPYEVPTIEVLNLPKICHTFAQLKQGFVLITGPTGHGKSTTLASILNEISVNRSEHIVTIEDPIEFIIQSKKSIVSQREIHSDTHSWDIALRSILREDPNVVLIGEMRDYETIANTLTIAETGHLVFSTLHTNSAAQTINRIIDVFPENSKAQVRMQLSSTLEAIFSQRLIPKLGGGRIVATEIIVATPAVRTTIREGKIHMLDNIIQTSGELGMMTLEASLADLVKNGKISIDVAREYALRPEDLMRMIQGR